MTVLYIVTAIILGFLLLCMGLEYVEARRAGKRIGFWQSLVGGIRRFFGSLLEGVTSLDI